MKKIQKTYFFSSSASLTFKKIIFLTLSLFLKDYHAMHSPDKPISVENLQEERSPQSILRAREQSEVLRLNLPLLPETSPEVDAEESPTREGCIPCFIASFCFLLLGVIGVGYYLNPDAFSDIQSEGSMENVITKRDIHLVLSSDYL